MQMKIKDIKNMVRDAICESSVPEQQPKLSYKELLIYLLNDKDTDFVIKLSSKIKNYKKEIIEKNKLS